ATPSGLALKTEVEWVQAPSIEGEFGVEPGHIPLLAVLKSGTLRYRAQGTTQIAAVGPGFVQAGPDKVLLLTDKFCAFAELQVQTVKKELEEAELQLRKYHGPMDDPRYAELRRGTEWARARRDVIRERGSN